MKKPPSGTFKLSALELIMISARTREILRGTGIEDLVVAVLRSCPTYQLLGNPVIWTIYSRGWLDWTANVTYTYNDPNLTNITTDKILQLVRRTESITYGNQMPLLPERYPGELEALRQRGISIIESLGGVSNAMDSIAIVVREFSLADIRSDPILWAVFTRAWEDRGDLEDSD